MTSPAIFSGIISPPSTIKPTLIPSSFLSTSYDSFRNPTSIKPNPHPRLTITTSASASDSTTTFDNPTSTPESPENENPVKIGARVRVKVPLIVYHIPKVSEVDLNGKEGVIKENIALWKGKHISANFPVKIEFLEVLDGRGDKPVKFFAHLREDEFDYIDCD